MKHLFLFAMAAAVSAAGLVAQETAVPPSRQAQEQALEKRRPAREPLSPEQQAKLRELNENLREGQRVLMARMVAVRRELERLSRAEELDEKAIRAKAAELGELEADLAILRGKYYRDLREVLPSAAAAAREVRSPFRQEIRRSSRPVQVPARRPVPPRQASPRAETDGQ